MDKSKKKSKKRKEPGDASNEILESEPKPKKKSKEIASVDQMMEVVKIKAALDSAHESKRSKKRKKNLEKAEKNTNTRADKKYHDEIISYIQTWESDKSSWKFQKTKQIFIQNNVFNDKIIIDDIWDTTLSYLSGSQGKAKDMLKGNAQKIIQKIDGEFEKSQNNDLLQQKNYLRARELLQMLD
uniref:CSON001826 protein n=1 Tax=Culicoides sonorensis TaxID=179676 RepID=A0A336L8D1_CULSO